MNNVFLSPIQRFIKAESFGGYLLFAATVLALLFSNLPTEKVFNSVLQYKIGIKSEHFELVKPVILWINDGLMAIFFFLIGLEIKREILIGELNSIKKASLPIFAAIGGMVLPVLMFLLLNQNPETQKGWGITMATDIAFALAILKLVGKRVPLGLKIFLTAFAIIDDLGAVIIVALFYTGEISTDLLLIAGAMLLVLYTLSLLKIHNKFILLFLGFFIWLLFLKSGIHPTIAGILIAFSIPIRQRINEFQYAGKLKEVVDQLLKSTNTNKLPILTKEQIEEIDNLEDWTSKVQSPLQQLEHRLHNWVAFLIMPVFALANAGVQFSSNMAIDMPLVITIAVSLIAGKAIGVSLFSYLSIKFNIASLPENITIKQLIGVAILSGVGFTMSLFIGGLAFFGNMVYLNSAKIGIIAGSLISGIIGYIVLKQDLSKNNSTQH